MTNKRQNPKLNKTGPPKKKKFIKRKEQSSDICTLFKKEKEKVNIPQKIEVDKKNIIEQKVIYKEWQIPDHDTVCDTGHPDGELKSTLNKIATLSQISDADITQNHVNIQLGEIDYTTRQIVYDGNHDPSWIMDKDIESIGGECEIPVVRIFGCTRNGTSVMVRVHGFEPYFYVLVPDEYIFPDNARHILDRKTLEKAKFSRSLGEKRKYEESEDENEDGTGGPGPAVVRIEIVTRIPIKNYTVEGRKFIKITTSLPRYVSILRDILEKSGSLDDDTPSFDTFEADILFPLRFMIDKGITGCDWLRIDLSHLSAIIAQREIGTGALMLEGGGMCESHNTSGRDYVKRPWKSDLLPDKYKRRCEKIETISKSCRCSVEIDVHHSAVTSLGTDGEWSIQAPLRILSFDTEWIGKGRAMAEIAIDPIITICTCVMTHGEKTTQHPVAFQLLECEHVTGSSTVWFDDEASMLLAWRDLVISYDPDIITGYNVLNFDFSYMFARAKTLKIINRFSDLGRVAGGNKELARWKFGSFSSKAQGTVRIDEVTIPGRTVYDMYTSVLRSEKLSSYKLNSVCSKYLGQQKLDVPYYRIPILFAGSPQDRELIARYCLKDAELPLLLAAVRMTIGGAVEMSRATSTPFSFQLSRGNQIKVACLMMSVCKNMNIILNSSSKRKGRQDTGAKFEGATVLTPIRGYKDEPIATLDFQSMYPMIMQAFNLCYTTYIQPEEVKNFNTAYVEITPNGDHFLQGPTYYSPTLLAKRGIESLATIDLVEGKHYTIGKNGFPYLIGGCLIPKQAADRLGLVCGIDYELVPDRNDVVCTENIRRPGILTIILQSLLEQRRKARRMLAQTKDLAEKAVYNGRQLALKVVANSVYGFTGAQQGRLPFPKIAANVTSYGRKQLEITKHMVEEKFPGSQIIYGDTDSVMVNFNVVRMDDNDVVKNGIKTTLPLVKKICGIDDNICMELEDTIRINVTNLSKPKDKEYLQRYRKIGEVIQTVITEYVYKKHITLSKINQQEITAAIKTGVEMPTIDIVAQLGVEACDYVTSALRPPSRLEFEKIFWPFILVSKKRYCGMKWMGMPKAMKCDPTVSAMGLETQRRDNCEVVRYTMRKVFDLVMRQGKLVEAIRFSRSIIGAIKGRTIPLDMLAITAGYSKKMACYIQKQRHTEVIKKMIKRDPASAPNIGDRVSFIMIQSPKNAKTYESAEELMFAMENKIPYDADYYIERQLRKPLSRIMRYLIPNVNRLFSTSSTIEEIITGKQDLKSIPQKMHITTAPPSLGAGSISFFLHEIGKCCVECNVCVDKDPKTGYTPALCPTCIINASGIYCKLMTIYRTCERALFDIKAHCIRCVGTLMQDIKCTNQNCSFTFLKPRLTEELEKVRTKLDRFNNPSTTDLSLQKVITKKERIERLIETINTRCENCGLTCDDDCQFKREKKFILQDLEDIDKQLMKIKQ